MIEISLLHSYLSQKNIYLNDSNLVKEFCFVFPDKTSSLSQSPVNKKVQEDERISKPKPTAVNLGRDSVDSSVKGGLLFRDSKTEQSSLSQRHNQGAMLNKNTNSSSVPSVKEASGNLTSPKQGTGVKWNSSKTTSSAKTPVTVPSSPVDTLGAKTVLSSNTQRLKSATPVSAPLSHLGAEKSGLNSAPSASQQPSSGHVTSPTATTVPVVRQSSSEGKRQSTEKRRISSQL